MACACKVNQELGYIAKKYGSNRNEKNNSLAFKYALKDSLTFIAVSIFLPIGFLIILVRIMFGDGKLRISDLPGFKFMSKNGRK